MQIIVVVDPRVLDGGIMALATRIPSQSAPVTTTETPKLPTTLGQLYFAQTPVDASAPQMKCSTQRGRAVIMMQT